MSVQQYGSGSQALICTLSYYYGEADEDREVRETVEFLFSSSSDGVVLYFRCPETVELAIEATTTLTIDDLFCEEYRPSFYDGIQYFFRLRRT